MFEISLGEASQRCTNFVCGEIWEVLGTVFSLEFYSEAHKAEAFKKRKESSSFPEQLYL